MKKKEKSSVGDGSEKYDLEQLSQKIQSLKEAEEPPRKVRKKIRQLEHLHRKIAHRIITQETLAPDDSQDDKQEAPEAPKVLKDTSDSEKEHIIKGVKRFVLFVGNLPKSASEEMLKRHFNKVGNIKSVRIPPMKKDKKTNFAFVELADRISYEKTLSMHHTMFENKRINVLFTNPDGKSFDKKEVQKKNAKLNALRKAGKLAGSIPEHQKRSFRRKKKRLAEAKAAQI